jgi:hypothetical protein
LSSSAQIATVAMPSSLAARKTRMAISDRLATRSFLIFNATASRMLRANASPLHVASQQDGSDDRKTPGEGVAVVDEDRVEAGHARPAGDGGDDGGLAADARLFSTRPLNCEPMMDSCTKSAPVFSRPWREAAPCAPRCRCRRASGRWPFRRRRRRCGHASLPGGVGAPVHMMWRRPVMPGSPGWTKSWAALRFSRRVRLMAMSSPAKNRPCRGNSPAARRWRRNCRHRRCRPDRPERGAVDLDAGRMQEGGDVGQPHLLHIFAFLPVFGPHQPGRRVEIEHARRLRPHQPVLDGEGDGADRAVAAHGQAAGGLDVETPTSQSARVGG